MDSGGIHSLFLVFVLFSISAIATNEPTGRLLLASAFVPELLYPTDSKTVNLTLTCSTSSKAGRLIFEYEQGYPEPHIFRELHDMRVDLLPHESLDCELTETPGDEETENSHGRCEYTYARFLAPASNAVTCSLNDGSSFTIRMDCGEDCPDPEPKPEAPYCKKTKILQSVDKGPSTLNDGSPGFALYAPNSVCAWKIPRKRRGATSFVFSRLDLGSGDVLTAYESSDGEKRKKIKEYTEESSPESVSTSEEYLILELTADDEDEGLGFQGFYYYTKEVIEPVQIAVQPEKAAAPSPPTKGTRSKSPDVGRRLV